MEQLIRDMLEEVYREQSGNYKHGHSYMERRVLLEFAKRLIDTLADSHNAPSDWRRIASLLAKEWNDGTWEYDTSTEHGSMFDVLALGDYGADECFGAGAFDEEAGE